MIERAKRSAPEADPVEELEGALLIDEHALDQALALQADCFYRVAKRLALAISRRDAAKNLLAEIEADVDRQLRADAANSGDKVTEKEIDSLKRLDADVKKATVDLLEEGHTVGKLSALKESFSQRGYALNNLTSLYVANYYESNAGNSAARGVKDKTYSRVREDLSEMRRTARDKL